MKVFVLPLIAAVLASCAPTTPEARIAANLASFQQLDRKHQELVRQGRLDAGMPAEAVALAWGPPARRFDGQDGAATTSRWDYAGSRPIYTTGWYGGFYGYGYWGRHAWAAGPEVTFIPYRRASVWFRNERVTRWEQVR